MTTFGFGRAVPLAIISLWCCSAGGSGWVKGWGNGTLIMSVQPGTSLRCDPVHQCKLVARGSSGARTDFGAGGEIGTGVFEADVTIDFPDFSTNGFGGKCFPMVGGISITTGEGNNASRLVLFVQGTECEAGSSPTLSVINGTYVADGANSTGKYGGISGVGEFHWSADSSSIAVLLAFSGNLHFQSPSQDSSSDF